MSDQHDTSDRARYASQMRPGMGKDLWERTGKKISLHGLGFLQVELTPTLRLHVWHPSLPRRTCAEHSNVHDHRFGFDSTVLAGIQINTVYSFTEVEERAIPGVDTYRRYKHDGMRTEFGNRPWMAFGQPIELVHHDTQVVNVGKTYHMRPYVFHSTAPGQNGKVATLMQKTMECEVAATSTCKLYVNPDVDFDRFQLSDDEAWRIIRDVMGG